LPDQGSGIGRWGMRCVHDYMVIRTL
jgi:hypothetical protein